MGKNYNLTLCSKVQTLMVNSLFEWLLKVNEIRLETEEEIERTEALNLEKLNVAAKLAERLRELKLGNSQSTLQGCRPQLFGIYSLIAMKGKLDNCFHHFTHFHLEIMRYIIYSSFPLVFNMQPPRSSILGALFVVALEEWKKRKVEKRNSVTAAARGTNHIQDIDLFKKH